MAKRLLRSAGIFVTIPRKNSQDEESGNATLVHNCPALHAALHHGSFEDVSSTSFSLAFLQAYAKAMTHALKELGQVSFPMLPSLQGTWLGSELAQATKRLVSANAWSKAHQSCASWSNPVSPGQEEDHLRRLRRFADHRGGEVRVHLMGN